MMRSDNTAGEAKRPERYGEAAAPLRASNWPVDPRSQIRDKALRAGFDAIGFCQASLGPEARERLTHFIQAGYHGDMGWLATRSDQRSHPRSLWPEARSIIAVGLCTHLEKTVSQSPPNEVKVRYQSMPGTAITTASSKAS